MRLLLILAVACVLVLPAAASATEVYWTAAHWMAPPWPLTRPAACDLDGDGDYDIAVIGWQSVWWNVGSPESPVWEYDEGGLEPPSDAWGPAAFGDVDGDGDPDMVAGYYLDCNLRFVRNVGTPQAFVWQYEPPPFPATPTMGAWPHFADFDADGDLDIMATHLGQGAAYLENVGTPAAPEWVINGSLGWGIIPPGSFPSMAPGDLDGDGDLDLVGQAHGYSYGVQAWENVGTPEEFLYVENPSLLLGVTEPQDGSLGVELLDIDADGDLDLLIAAWPDNYLYLNERITPVESKSWGAIKAMYR
jgi:hypothetical protein